MKKECIKLLKSKGYEVDKETGSIETDSILSELASIEYEEHEKQFGLLISPIEVIGTVDLKSYISQIKKLSKLVEQLNEIA